MNNADEQVHHRSSSLTTAIYYVVGSIISLDNIRRDADFSRLLLWRGTQQVTPFAAVTIRIFGYRIFCSKLIMKKFVRFKKK